MADRTQLRAADHNDIADDDPFAELTKIMGFDPRQPVKPQAPVQPKPAPAESFANEGDFDVDLEKELMGEFGTTEAAAEAHEPAYEAAGDTMDDELVASFEQDFVLDDDVADEPLHHAAMAADVPAPAFDDTFDQAFDNAVASSLEDVSPLEDDLSADDELAASLEREFQLDDHAVDETAYQVAAELSEPAVETAFEPDFDTMVASELADELKLDDHLAVEDHAGYAAVASVGDTAPARAISDEDFVGHFDNAMADVDMDFDVRADQRAGIDEPHAHDVLAESSAARAEGPGIATDAAFDDDFELNFDDALAEEVDEPVARVAKVEPMVPAALFGEPRVQAAAPNERSLEDELNALLGTMTARTAPVAKEPVMVHQPIATPRQDASAPTDLVGDLDWDLDEEAPAAPQQLHAVQAPEVDLDNLLLDELESQDFDVEDGAAPVAQAAAAHTQAASRATPSLNWPTPRATAPEPARSWSRITPVAQQQPAFSGQAPAASPAAAAPSYQGGQIEREPAYVAPAPMSREPSARYDEMPDVETVDVPERVVALADDLDIPELNFDDDEPTAPGYGDLDAEFASLLTEMNTPDVPVTPSRGAAAAYDDESYSAGFRPGYEQDRGGARAYPARPVETPANAAYADATSGYAAFEAGDLPGSQPRSGADDFAVDELDYDPELDDAMSVPGLAEREAARQPRGRGLFIAAIVGGVAVLGGIGAFALHLGGKSGSDVPVIVKADNAPIKVKPQNPGGTVVPNQDNKVYDAVVKGAKPTEPVQEKLVTNTEEPVDVTAKEPQSRVVDLSPDETDASGGTDAAGNADTNAAPAPKSEDRIAQVLQEADKSGNPDIVAVAPRKVRTMVVKSDGSLVPREDPTPAPMQVAAAEPTDPAPQHVVNPAQADGQQTGTVPPLASQTNADQPAKPATVKPAKAETKAQSANTPAKVPVAPQRPAEQPVDIVGEVKPDQVASISPTAAASGGSWSMQIASQPSVESAQSTYQDLQRRYSSVLSGRTANIVKAEVAGKGTFYRVRVPAKSRNDAVSLCTSYKAAGGNCFVSR